MFSLAKEILEVKTKGEEWDWEDFEAVVELMDEEATKNVVIGRLEANHE